MASDLLRSDKVQLPGFPEVLLRLDEELRRPEVDFGRVSRLVAMDPVLSGQILRVANSAWYSRGGSPVQELSRALLRLGIPVTRDLVQALVLPALFPRLQNLDPDAYWRHSFAVAMLAQTLGRLVGLDRSRLEVIWTAGLLHDIGAVILDMVATDKFRQVFTHSSPTGNLVTVEQDVLGTDHANLGSQYLEKVWKLPPLLVRCVRYHEEPGWTIEEPDLAPILLSLHLADAMCEARGVCWSPSALRKAVPREAIWRRLGLDPSMEESLGEEVEKSVERAVSMLAK